MFRHALAREALLKSLELAEMMKVYSVRESAATIWTCLHEEYGQVLDIEYIRADNQFHALRKTPETSMNDHINQFTKHLQDVEYHKPGMLLQKTKEQLTLHSLLPTMKTGHYFSKQGAIPSKTSQS